MRAEVMAVAHADGLEDAPLGVVVIVVLVVDDCNQAIGGSVRVRRFEDPEHVEGPDVVFIVMLAIAPEACLAGGGNSDVAKGHGVNAAEGRDGVWIVVWISASRGLTSLILLSGEVMRKSGIALIM